jgi:sulfite reductase (NADPH) flavoprotein alpha-component
MSSRFYLVVSGASFLIGLANLFLFPNWLTSSNTKIFSSTAFIIAYLSLSLACWRHFQAKKNVYLSNNPVEKFSDDDIHIVFASQTGFAELLAHRTLESLQQAKIAAQLLPIDNLDAEKLSSLKKILFIVSTTGEGDAPDSASGFIRHCMKQNSNLSHLEFAILGLGDKKYAAYCAFAHRLQHFLHQQGARELFDLVEVDNGDAAALRHWQTQLHQLTGQIEISDWSRPAYQHWQLVERRCLNPNSQGAPCFHLSLQFQNQGQNQDDQVQWQAGDIVEIAALHTPEKIHAYLRDLHVTLEQEEQLNSLVDNLVEHLRSCRLIPCAEVEAIPANPTLIELQLWLDQFSPLAHREYSIANIPVASSSYPHPQLDLLVRLAQQANGEPGIASGFLCLHSEIKQTISLRIRSNPQFHAPEDDRALILIGNGTGLAGLRAHLQQREQALQQQNWLFFGERQAEFDFFHQEEILNWQKTGVLQRLDLAFSRDQEQKIYVQDKLLEQAQGVQDWIAQGAAIYVCGSLQGMAQQVHLVLETILGKTKLEELREQGRYRRDVY